MGAGTGGRFLGWAASRQLEPATAFKIQGEGAKVGESRSEAGKVLA